MSRILIGLVLVALGVALAIICGLADVIGLSASERSDDDFGWLQIAGMVAGVAAVLVGIVLAALGGRRRRTTPS